MDKLNPREQAIKDFIWDYLSQDSNHGRNDRVNTAWGTKTIQGLTACLERIFEETKTQIIEVR